MTPGQPGHTVTIEFQENNLK